MSLFSSITDSLKIPESTDSVGDDNAGLSADQNNPLLSAAILGMRTAYDGMHSGFAYLVKAKKSSLAQTKKYIYSWIDTLNSIVEKYREMLSKIDELKADVTGIVTLDFAKEAWDIIQDTPILRRYLGEANYWYLYDTLGLLATQTGSISADAMTGIKQAIKQAILAVISSTDGLISLQSYMGYLQSAWGFLYVKCLDSITLDSILPQVTTAYWYKPTHTSVSKGDIHSFTLTNNPPGIGFVPVPVPIPNPIMYSRDMGYISKFNPQNPDTWYLNGAPYYMPNTMDLLHRALNYWGSSYTDAEHIPNLLYSRRKYEYPGDSSSDHPLKVGQTLYQLDTEKLSIAGSSIQNGNVVSESIKGKLDSVFTPSVLEAMVKWDVAYKNAYRVLVTYIFSLYEEEAPRLLTYFWRDHQAEYHEWLNSSSDTAIMFNTYVNEMTAAWVEMLSAYDTDNGLPIGSTTPNVLFDRVMTTLVEVGHESSGYEFSLDSNETFMVGPSFNPNTMDNVTQDQNWSLGVPYISYRVDASTGTAHNVIGDVVATRYPISSAAFVMFPSDYTSPEITRHRSTEFSYVPESLEAMVTSTSGSKNIGDTIDSGIVLEYTLPIGMENGQQKELGAIPDALCLHRSCGIGKSKDVYDSSGNAIAVYLGNLFFPEGIIPESVEDALPLSTFLDVYNSYKMVMSSANDELADIVGYSVNQGREPKFPCFGVYGNLLRMASWNYKEMDYATFYRQYRSIRSGSKLYYKKSDPSKIILYHSSYFSQSRQVQLAIYHDYVAKETKSYGPNDSYTYYVFPGESISVSKLPTSGMNGYNLGKLLSIDATSPLGDNYHYAIIKNPAPLCPKYVDPKQWSFMDVVYELLLLATNLSGLCGDNGKRLNQLESDLEDFGITVPSFLGELPEDNGKLVDFQFGVLNEYARDIELAINSVYNFRSQLIAATESW